MCSLSGASKCAVPGMTGLLGCVETSSTQELSTGRWQERGERHLYAHAVFLPKGGSGTTTVGENPPGQKDAVGIAPRVQRHFR